MRKYDFSFLTKTFDLTPAQKYFDFYTDVVNVVSYINLRMFDCRHG